MDKVIFVSDGLHLQSDIPGGVQICTQEYIELLEACDLELIVFPVESTRSIITRIKIKLGIELFQRYGFSRVSGDLIRLIEKEDAKYIALNQVALIGFGHVVKECFGDRVKVLVLSHGNESGDMLHSIVRREKKFFLSQFKDISHLGFVLYKESHSFINDIDIVLSISDTEKEINNWLGAKVSVFIPRTFSPKFLDWKPDLNRIGFVGTLNHKPNLDSLTALIEALEYKSAEQLRVRVVGSPEKEGRELDRKYETVEYLGQLNNTDLEKEIESWAIFLNPVSWYSRGATTKLALGINLGLPVSSTQAGNRGYEWTKGAVLTADNIGTMADQILENVGSIVKLSALAKQVRLIPYNAPTIHDIANKLREFL